MEKKPILMQIILFVLAMGVCLGLYLGLKLYIIDIKEKEIVRVKDNFKSFYQLDMEIDSNNPNKIGFNGVYFKLNQNTLDLEEKSDVSVLLVNVENPKEVYVFPVIRRTERIDIEKYFKCDYLYLFSGIVTEKKEIKLKEKTYEVLLKEKKMLSNSIETGLFVKNGQLVRYNPDTFRVPDVVGTELEKIVTDGYLMAYRPDFDVWVYQYEWRLYWIAGPNFFFEENNSTYIQLQMETTQVDRLPEERLMNGWNWSNIGDRFEKHEIIGGLGERGYRVSVRDIPVEYATYHIWTGYYDVAWVWRNDFRPVLN